MNILFARKLAASLVVVALAGCTAKSPESTSETPLAPTSDSASPAVASPAVASSPAESEAAELPTAIPDTADAIWKAIDQQSADLKATIQGTDLKEVHHKAFAIRDLVAALPAHSPKLTADDETKLQGEVKFVATLADRLDAAGDSGDKAAAQANYDKLVGVLNGITRNK